MSTAKPNVRPSGLYWVQEKARPRGLDRPPTVMRWADFLYVWNDTHGDKHDDDDVTVLSERLRPPGEA